VHRALKQKKAQTGVNVKDLGNCVLRSVLERPLLVDAIGERLVAEGRLSEAEFEGIRAEALRRICASAEDVANIVQPTGHQTLATGSWELEELTKDEEGTYQVLRAWVRDHRMRPITLHKHEGVEFLMLLSGAALITIHLESQVLRAPATVLVPGQAMHSVTPLERDTRLLAVLSPPEPGYSSPAT
jgi:mannose-6-phosphate isomerase-like protein (cupin superfamily)